MIDLQSELGDLNADTVFSQSMPILPPCILKLRRRDFNLLQHDAISGRYGTDDHMNPSIKTKHQRSMRSIQHKVPARQKDLARRRDGYRIVNHWTSDQPIGELHQTADELEDNTRGALRSASWRKDNSPSEAEMELAVRPRAWFLVPGPARWPVADDRVRLEDSTVRVLILRSSRKFAEGESQVLGCGLLCSRAIFSGARRTAGLVRVGGRRAGFCRYEGTRRPREEASWTRNDRREEAEGRRDGAAGFRRSSMNAASATSGQHPRRGYFSWKAESLRKRSTGCTRSPSPPLRLPISHEMLLQGQLA